MASPTGKIPLMKRMMYQRIASLRSARGRTAKSFHSLRSRRRFSKTDSPAGLNGATKAVNRSQHFKRITRFLVTPNSQYYLSPRGRANRGFVYLIFGAMRETGLAV